MMTLTPLRIPAPASCAVWRIDLDQQVSPAASALLSEAEAARARRFVFARDRTRFVAAHAALRQLLARRTGLSGEWLRLVEGPFGKPALDSAALHFNLSHSQNIGVVALSEELEVGIDVEAVRPMPDARAMAVAYFTPAEQSALAMLAASDAHAAERAFFVCWTRKEACLKALGLGLQLATNSFEVGLHDMDGQVRTIEIATSSGTERLQLQSFLLDMHAVGAFATRCVPTRFSAFSCDGAHVPFKAFA